jgi:carbonic anhydrase/acetyltransferase-like protein (isoleucine patch superfamily)
MIYKKNWKYILCKDNSSNCSDYGYYRPKAIKDFSDISKGDIGGYLKRFNNLSQSGDCWIYDEAIVTIRASVKDNVKIRNSALICGHAKVSGNAMVSGRAIVAENAWVYDNAQVKDNAKVCDDAHVYGNARISSFSLIDGNTHVCGDTEIRNEVISE